MKVKRYVEFYYWNPPEKISDVEQLKTRIYNDLVLMGYHPMNKEVQDIIDNFSKVIIEKLGNH
jgi:hypothetical protein